jgi:hypothetical protein
LRRLLQRLRLLVLEDDKLAWITFFAIAILTGCAGLLLYLAAMMQQSA